MRSILILTILAVLAFTGCSSSSNTNNANNATDMGADACVPAQCADQCGMVDDGCEGMLDCGVCTCTDQDFETFCPEMPCLTVSGCSADGECEYSPVSCQGAECACDDEDCTHEELRRCSDSDALTCPADVCNPAPTENGDGTFSYANTCEQPEGATCDHSDICIQGACVATDCEPADCGSCNLGHWDCNDAVVATCYDLPASAAPVDMLNCNDRTAESTFIYVDQDAGVDDAGSGSRSQPFLTLSAATAAAQTRGTTALVVKSGYTESGSWVLTNGISIYSGFSGAPDWTYDEGYLEVISGMDDYIAIDAIDIDVRTVLHRVRVEKLNNAGYQSAYGVRAVNASALILSEVQIQVGRGGRTTRGDQGTPGRTGGKGGQTGTSDGGLAGINSDCPSANGGAGGAGGAHFAQFGEAGLSSPAGNAGGLGVNPGEDGLNGTTATRMGEDGVSGAGGIYGYLIIDNFWQPTGVGQPGAAGGPGDGGGGGSGGGGSNDTNHPSGAGGGGSGGSAGGCGGGGGSGGGGGGKSSFGVFAINSAGLEIVSSTIVTADGGYGGYGGDQGYAGGGGRSLVGSPGGSASGAGGMGGHGSLGGWGGAGGGGAGGDSISVHCEGGIVVITDSVLTHGEAGQGATGSGIFGSPDDSQRGEDGNAMETRGCQ